jgi:carbamoyl-phosphate synthase/aspartate carbamoyltransferase/dihydroorotase
MPNNVEPITTIERLRRKRQIAAQKIVCDVGFHFGSLGDNFATFDDAAPMAMGLKLYLNHTTGDFLFDLDRLRAAYEAWPAEQVILLHAEDDVVATALEALAGLQRRVHVCHVSTRAVLEQVVLARERGCNVTVGVCAHHLFLSQADEPRLKWRGRMRPPLSPPADVDYLWQHLDQVDIFESDHAPHAVPEKEAGAYGVPGLETTLPLLLKAVDDGRLEVDDIVRRCSTNPAHVFGIEVSDETYVEVELGNFAVREEDLFTRCGWSPFAGADVGGRVRNVVLRGEHAFEDGRVLVSPGSGRLLASADYL